MSRAYIKLPLDVLDDNQLSHADVRVYSVLIAFKGKNDSCSLGAGVLGQRTGLSRNTLFKCLKKLKDKGLIVVKSGWRYADVSKVNTYFFPHPVHDKKQGPGLIQSPAPSKQVFVDKPGSSTAEAIARLKSKLT